MELWKNIEDYPNYQISNLGKVRNCKTGRVRKTWTNHKGYVLTRLHKDGERKAFSIHRLIANTFLGKELGEEVDHINHLRADNRLENLRWVSALENRLNSKPRGSISIERVEKIVELYKNGFTIQEIVDCFNNQQ